jgi:fused signal recognition particle receptor
LAEWIKHDPSGAESKDPLLVSGQPHIVMVVGVNGVGKTTTTGKLAARLRQCGFDVVVGAADTFRAAAVEQLRVWSDRAGASFVTLKEGGDPAAVAFEAVKQACESAGSQNLAYAAGTGAASSKGTVCLVDTAGRLHNRKDLMDELTKVRRVMGRQCPGAPHEVLLVVDATTGQNAVQQALLFGEAAGVTGFVLTKIDGTAKGGVALALAAERGVPIQFVGVGEAIDDLQVFEAETFVSALLDI